MYSINCRGKLIDLTQPKVMGILNLSADSFFDGGDYHDASTIITQVAKMIDEGASFIDVGAVSTLPGAQIISETQEMKLIIPTIQLLVAEFPNIILSVDTTRSNVAKKGIDLGASIINDISAGNGDPEMFHTISDLQVPYVMMHMQGNPETMQLNPEYENITTDILHFFSSKMEDLYAKGVNDIISDVGFGFGKTLHHNYELLRNLDLFQQLEIPTLVGISRKSMLYKPLNLQPHEALNSTTAANTIALQKGANILRVHDVKEAVESIKVFQLTFNKSQK